MVLKLSLDIFRETLRKRRKSASAAHGLANPGARAGLRAEAGRGYPEGRPIAAAARRQRPAVAAAKSRAHQARAWLPGDAPPVRQFWPDALPAARRGVRQQCPPHAPRSSLPPPSPRAEQPLLSRLALRGVSDRTWRRTASATTCSCQRWSRWKSTMAVQGEAFRMPPFEPKRRHFKRGARPPGQDSS